MLQEDRFKCMDEISFTIEQGDRWEIVNIFVNSRNLIDIIREIELPFAMAEGHPNIAGNYVGLPKKVALLPSRHLLGESSYRAYGFAQSFSLLICECGEPGCWPLKATITATDTEVIWHDFRQYHRSLDSKSGHWKYDALAPFRFRRQQYEDALKRASGDN